MNNRKLANKRNAVDFMLYFLIINQLSYLW